jgi:hypothetical protein
MNAPWKKPGGVTPPTNPPGAGGSQPWMKGSGPPNQTNPNIPQNKPPPFGKPPTTTMPPPPQSGLMKKN